MKQPEKDSHTERLSRIAATMRELGQAGLLDTPRVKWLRRQLLHPGNSRTFHRALRQLEDISRTPAAIKRIEASRQACEIPEPRHETSILLGHLVGSGRELRIDTTPESQRIFVDGPSGSGKTTAVNQLIREFVHARPGLQVNFVDQKGDGLRYCRLWPDRCVVVSPTSLSYNIIEPIGEPVGYATTLGSLLRRHVGLLPRHDSVIAEFLLGVYASRPEGESLPCLADVIEGMVTVGHASGETSLVTVGKALRPLVSLLGQSARVRTGPEPGAIRPIVIYDNSQAPPEQSKLLMGIQLLRRFQLARLQGHSSEARALDVFDESISVLGKEFQQSSGSGFQNPFAQHVRLARSQGTCMYFCSQSFGGIDSVVLDNVHVIVVTGVSSVDEARTAREILNLPRRRQAELLSLGQTEAFVRIGTMREAVKVVVPYCDLGPYLSQGAIDALQAPVRAELAERIVYADTVKTVVHPQINRIKRALYGQERETDPEPERPIEPVDPAPFVAELCAFLVDVKEHPEASIRERGGRLGWGNGKVLRTRNRLTSEGLLTQSTVTSGTAGRGRQRLELTEQGKEYLDEFGT